MVTKLINQRLLVCFTRVILIEQHVIFIYNDLNVLAKASWQLNPSELELTITARNEIKKLREVQHSSARVNEAAEDKISEKKVGLFEKVHHKVDEFFEPIVKPVVEEIEEKIEKKKEFFENVHDTASKILEEKKEFIDKINPFNDHSSSKKEEVKN